jgi:hypothetical protein
MGPVKRRSSRLQLARRATNSREWHEMMGAAPAPDSVFAKRGFKTWDAVHTEMARGMLAWEMLPEPVRIGYAFRNPEDR